MAYLQGDKLKNFFKPINGGVSVNAMNSIAKSGINIKRGNFKIYAKFFK